MRPDRRRPVECFVFSWPRHEDSIEQCACVAGVSSCRGEQRTHRISHSGQPRVCRLRANKHVRNGFSPSLTSEARSSPAVTRGSWKSRVCHVTKGSVASPTSVDALKASCSLLPLVRACVCFSRRLKLKLSQLFQVAVRQYTVFHLPDLQCWFFIVNHASFFSATSRKKNNSYNNTSIWNLQVQKNIFDSIIDFDISTVFQGQKC